MTDLEYVQNMPAAHLLHQRQVNAELWHQWNLADHKRAIAGPYCSEKDLRSRGAALAQGYGSYRADEPYPVDAEEPPPSISLCYSICSRRWRQEQEGYMNARIGDIVFAKDGTGVWDTSGVRVTYAMERVDEPHRWNKYRVYHLESERFQDMIKQYTQ